MEHILNDVLHWVFPLPTGCAVCGRQIEHYSVCRICRQIHEHFFACPRCGRAMRMGGLCSDCRRGRFHFYASRAAGVLRGNLHQAVLRFKYAHQSCLAAPLAEWMADSTSFPLPDWVCSVPSDKVRQRQRGYNASELLARELASCFKLPYRQVLSRTPGRRPPQEGADYDLRWQQVADLYRVEAHDRSLVQSTVWVVDDVITTGATLSACAQALRNRGAERVYGVALATTPPQKVADKFPGPQIHLEEVWV